MLSRRYNWDINKVFLSYGWRRGVSTDKTQQINTFTWVKMERHVTHSTHTETTVTKLAMDICTKTGAWLQEVTQSYLGAMNTCPSDSKVFGRRDSKSATETGKIIQRKRRTENTGRLLRNKWTSAAPQKWGRYHSNTEESWGNTSVSHYGAFNGVVLAEIMG